jgi:nucleoside-diphosphate-sugar epimerase
MKILVVGASGFLGGFTVNELQRRGHEVIPAARSAAGFLQLDITDESACRAVLESGRYDCVLNLAGRGVTAGTSNDLDMNDTNVRGAVFLARAAARLAEPPWYLHASSSTEPLPGATPESIYSTTKAQGTALTSNTLEQAGVPHAIVRIHNTYGPGQPAGRFVVDLVSRLTAGDPVVLNFPDRVRDFCFVTDIAEQLAALAERPRGYAAAVEIGTGIGTSLWDAATVIRERLGAAAALVSRSRDALPDPQPFQVADSEAASFLACATPFADGVRVVVASVDRKQR